MPRVAEQPLPEGRRRSGGAVDVRRHRPALRPRQPDHDVPHGRRLAAHDRAPPRPRGPGPGCSTWRAAPATCAASWRRRDCGRSASTCRFGMLAAARTDAPLVQADALRLPVPDGAGGRRHVRLRAPQLRRARRRSSPSWPGSCARAGASRCSRWPSRRTGSCAGATALLRQGRPAHRRAAVRPRRLPLPAPVGRLPARARRCCSRMLAAAGFADAERDLLSGGIAQLLDRRPAAVTTRRPSPGRVDARRRPARASPARDGVALRARTGRAWPGGARRPRVPDRRASTTSLGGRSRSTTRSACPAAGRSPSAPSRSTGARTGATLVVPRAIVGPGRRRHPLGHHDRRTDDRRDPTPPAPTTSRSRRRPGSTVAPVHAAGLVVRPRRRRPPRRIAGRRRCDKVVLAREVVVDADAPDRPSAAVLDRLRAALPGLLRLLASTASSAPAPSCSSAGRATSCAPSRWPAPRPAAATPPTDARARGRRCSASAKDRHEHQITIDMVHDTLLPVVLVPRLRGRAVGRRAWPTCSTSPRSVEGRLSQPRAVGARARRAPCTRRPRCAAGPASVALDVIAELRGLRPRPLRRHRSAGSTRAGNGTWAVGIRCAEHRRRAPPASTPATASSPTPTPTPSWPRPRPSSRRC